MNGRWRHAGAALRACRSGEWARFARESAPARPLLAGRRDHARCLELAERSLAGPVTAEVTLVPLWACSTEDETSAEWVAVHGVLQQGKPLRVLEAGPFIGVDDASPRADALWECTVRRWTAATVVEGRGYAPSVPLRLRAGAFGVLELDVDEVLSVAAREAESLPRPTRVLPMFATWFTPRVAVAAELEEQIEALGFTADVD